MTIFGDLKVMLALALVAFASIAVDAARAGTFPQATVLVSSGHSAFSGHSLSSHQPAVDELSKMKVMAEYLTSKCGESNADVSFTADELSTLVLLGESKPRMRSRICSAFTGRRAA
jgi:hypothetical protein